MHGEGDARRENEIEREREKSRKSDDKNAIERKKCGNKFLRNVFAAVHNPKKYYIMAMRMHAFF